MSAPTPREGERWAVRLEGLVTDDACGLLSLLPDGATDGILIYAHEGTWERLPDPEPAWAPGDLVIDADGVIYRRRDPSWANYARLPWQEVGFPDWASEDTPTRPLTRLVPEGGPRG